MAAPWLVLLQNQPGIGAHPARILELLGLLGFLELLELLEL